jgi:hypothetical protein
VKRTEAEAVAEALAGYQAKLDARADLQHPDEHPGTVDGIAAVLGPVRLRIARDKARLTRNTALTPQTGQAGRKVASNPDNGQTNERGRSGDR